MCNWDECQEGGDWGTVRIDPRRVLHSHYLKRAGLTLKELITDMIFFFFSFFFLEFAIEAWQILITNNWSHRIKGGKVFPSLLTWSKPDSHI